MAGEKVTKFIGFDADENHRAKGSGGTFAVKGMGNLCPDKELPHYRDRYDLRFPLREQGIIRSRCREIIVEAGLPVPPKSACTFCPASKQWEISRLAVVDPAAYVLCIAMEVIYRTGHHYRGDGFFTVSGVHRDTKEKVKFECFGKDAADARNQFRNAYKDVRDDRGYVYKLSVKAAVGGLDFGKPWMKVPATLPNEYQERLKHFFSLYGHTFELDNRTLPVLRDI